MPELNGLEVLQEIRLQDSTARVIIMTGYADLENAIAAINTGAYAFFRKPLEMDKLKECLQKIERENEQGKHTRDLGDELVKLCLELKDFEQSIGVPRSLGDDSMRRRETDEKA